MNNLSDFHSKSIKECLSGLNSSANGLSEDEAKARASSMPKAENSYKKHGIVSKFFEQFFDLMIIILLFASAVSIVIGIIEGSSSEIIDGCIILFIVLMNAIFGVVQEYKAEKSLEALSKLTEPETFVRRGGQLIKINTNDLVLGDVVSLEAGAIVPADLRLIESHQLQIDESSLTGESHAISKDAESICSGSAPISERKNMAYKGTVVTNGRGYGLVAAIGENTELGKIEKAIKDNQKELTPLQKSIKDVGKILTYLVLGVAVLTFIIEICINPANIMDAFLTSVAISVAAIPESMPAVITIIMSLGVARLAKQRAIVKRMHSVETLGCCDVICSDKTGTITQNKMTVTSIFFDGKLQEKKFSCDKDMLPFIKCALTCNDTSLSKGKILGDPTEVALTEFCAKLKYNKLDYDKKLRRIDELPFDSSRKMMSVLVDDDGQNIMYSKGALDRILNHCTFILQGGKVVPLSAEAKSQIFKANDTMSSGALRVLALACKQVKDKNDFKEDGLVFLGLAGMIDPPRKEIKDAVKKCKRAGMKPIMITGDYSKTAFAIAKEIGLAEDFSQVITGSEIAKMSDREFQDAIENYHIFTRVSSENKVRIVEALKAKGHVVAMTGDGVNDAPSLKKANIGIGMGITGTDVAKEVSDLIITDDNFATIVVAVEEGRKIYQNIQKTVKFLFSANLAELFSLFIVTLLFPQYIFLFPVQILFVNLITDSLPAIALGVEKPERDLMDIPPRDPKKGLFSNGIGWSIVILGLFQTLFVVLAYVIGILCYNEGIAVTMSFYTLNIIQMFYLASMRTNSSIFKSKPFENKFFLLAVGFCFVLIGLFAFTPLQSLLNLRTLNVAQWLIIFGFSFAMLVVSEIYKVIEKRILSRKSLKINKIKK